MTSQTLLDYDDTFGQMPAQTTHAAEVYIIMYAHRCLWLKLKTYLRSALSLHPLNQLWILTAALNSSIRCTSASLYKWCAYIEVEQCAWKSLHPLSSSLYPLSSSLSYFAASTTAISISLRLSHSLTKFAIFPSSWLSKDTRYHGYGGRGLSITFDLFMSHVRIRTSPRPYTSVHYSLHKVGFYPLLAALEKMHDAFELVRLVEKLPLKICAIATWGESAVAKN